MSVSWQNRRRGHLCDSSAFLYTMLLLTVRQMQLIVVAFLQEDCARSLLFRGADRSVKNRSSQTAYELAINTGNIQLADVIDSFSERDVGK